MNYIDLRKYRFIFILFCFYKLLSAQGNDSTELFKKVESVPEFPEGLKGLFNYLEKNKRYPEDAKKVGDAGVAIVKFIINNTGAVSRPVILQTSGNIELDKEAIRLVNTMPVWKPAILDGKAVSTYYTIPIKLGDNKKVEEKKNDQKRKAMMAAQEGIILLEHNQYSTAKDKLKIAILNNYRDINSKFNLAVAYYKLNEVDSACYVWSELINDDSLTEVDKDQASKNIKRYCINKIK